MPVKINDEYDTGKAFQAVEEELIASMIRNMKRHKAEETEEGIQWTMWQTEQLRALEKYKRTTRKTYRQQFRNINAQIETLIRMARDEGEMSQEIAILNAIKKGFPAKRISREAAAEFFHLNERKLEALIEATLNDMQRAETAVLRMANDKYRSVIYNAQVYANTGAGTYEKAVDMATKDFLSAGLNCVQYVNGARHTLSDYADMAVRTASKRAYLQGEGGKRNEWGIHTVIINKRGNPCPKCLPFCGKVLIDDVWSGGSRRDGDYPLMSHAVSMGLYHPRCKDSHTTYFPGLSTADDTWTDKELEKIGIQAKNEARQQYASRQSERLERLEKYSLDEENKKYYEIKKEAWGKDRKTNIRKPVNIRPVGKIDKDIYKCITDEITTKDVIITDERIEHIKERHPNDFERFCGYLPQIVKSPDYILGSDKANTAVILKEIQENGEKFKVILRLKDKNDPEGYKNSIISFWHIGETTWKKNIKNKKILYRNE